MDPEMVHQQDEAEREALKLFLNTLPVPEPGKKSVFLPGTARKGGRTGLLAGMPPFLSQARLSKPELWSSITALLGRFISFDFASAILAKGLAAAVAQQLQLNASLAKLAIAGATGFISTLCGFASCFAAPLAPGRRS